MRKSPDCRICRKVGEKLFLKGEKCNLPSCPFEKKSYAPGQGGARRRRKQGSDYSVQLIEKQKAKAIYGISERQMSNYFEEARKKRASTGEELLKILESRLDNVVYRLGWAESRSKARQMVTHGKISVNGKCVKSPSYRIKVADKISTVEANLPSTKAKIPDWIKLTKGKNEAEIISSPINELMPFNVQLIVEYYSR
jgi:small subunit ribosomal protein S4